MAFLQCVCVIVFLQVTCFNGRTVAFITRDCLLSGMCLHVYIEVLLLWTRRCTAYTSKRLLSGIDVYVPFEGARCCAWVATMRADERPFCSMPLAGTKASEKKIALLATKRLFTWMSSQFVYQKKMHCVQTKDFSPLWFHMWYLRWKDFWLV